MVPYGVISIRDYQTNFKSCRIRLLEFSPFLTMTFAQVFCWMSLIGWERLEYIRLKQLAVTMYKIHNNLSPLYLRRIFTNTSNVHSHNLRNSELNYYVPRHRTESAKGYLHYRGSVLWNKIPSEIRKLPSLNVFKTSFHGKDFSNTP